MKVFGFQIVVSSEEQGLWWDSDNHYAFEGYEDGKPGWGIKIAFRGGDVLHPYGVAEPETGDVFWQNNKWWNPKKIFKFRVPIPILPFVGIALGNYGLYFGFKDYPVHHDNYYRWVDRDNIYPGSRALCLSASIRKTRAT